LRSSGTRALFLTIGLLLIRWKKNYDKDELQIACSKHLGAWSQRHLKHPSTHELSPAQARSYCNSLASSYTAYVKLALRKVAGEASSSFGPKRHPFAFSSPLYNRAVKRHQQSGERLHRVLQSGNVQLISECRAAHSQRRRERTALYKTLANTTRDAVYQRIEQELQAAPSRFWRSHSSLLSRPALPVPAFVTGPQGVLVSDSSVVLQK
jgi:hypothetical protein